MSRKKKTEPSRRSDLVSWELQEAFDRSFNKPSELTGVEGKENVKGLSSQEIINRVKEIFPEITFRDKILDRWCIGLVDQNDMLTLQGQGIL